MILNFLQIYLYNHLFLFVTITSPTSSLSKSSTLIDTFPISAITDNSILDTLL